MLKAKFLLGLSVCCLLALGAFANAQASEEASAHTFSGTLTGTTDFVFRGISNSDEQGSVQGSFDYGHASGFYAGIWGANSAFAQDVGGQLEVDWYVGYANAFESIDYDLTLFYYTFPDANDDPEYNYFELHAGLSHTLNLGSVPTTLGVGYNFSPDFFGEDGTGHYVNALVDLALPYNFGVGAEFGYQTVEGDKSTGNGMGMDADDGFDYIHWRVSGNYAIEGFTFDISYHQTNSDAEDFYGDIADSRWVFTVSRSL